MNSTERMRTDTDYAYSALMNRLAARCFPTALGRGAFMFGGVHVDPVDRDGRSVKHLGLSVYKEEGATPVVIRVSAPDVTPPAFQLETQEDGRTVTWDYDPNEQAPEWASRTFGICGLEDLVVPAEK